MTNLFVEGPEDIVDSLAKYRRQSLAHSCVRKGIFMIAFFRMDGVQSRVNPIGNDTNLGMQATVDCWGLHAMVYEDMKMQRAAVGSMASGVSCPSSRWSW